MRTNSLLKLTICLVAIVAVFVIFIRPLAHSIRQGLDLQGGTHVVLQAEDTDILTGKSISPTGGVLFECLIYLLYSSGAFLVFLGLVYASYEVWPVTHLLPFPTNFSIPLFFAERIAWLMTFMMLMSAPIAVACLLVDVSLGLINRFAPQLNAYVLAMPIKSGLASFLLYFYIAYILNQSPKIFQHIDAAILKFKSLMPT